VRLLLLLLLRPSAPKPFVAPPVLPSDDERPNRLDVRFSNCVRAVTEIYVRVRYVRDVL